MKYLLILSLFFTTLFGTAQVSGKIALDGRKMIKGIPFIMDMKTPGILVFNIAVDNKGNVTSCMRDKAASNIKSTLYAYQAKNIILMQLKFEKGNGYPKFHQGTITITARLPE